MLAIALAASARSSKEEVGDKLKWITINDDIVRLADNCGRATGVGRVK